MDITQIAALILLGAFYISYMIKTLLLKRRNINADILGRGQKPKGRASIETALKRVTYSGVVIQVASIVFDEALWGLPVFPTMREDGLILMLLGVDAFILAIMVMRDNWRAGYSEEQKTSLVTVGIYKYSRNPEFLGFDLLYLGCALAFPNVLNIAFMTVAVVLFHIQILGEEVFLAKTFGDEYRAYKAITMRYLGRRKGKT